MDNLTYNVNGLDLKLPDINNNIIINNNEISLIADYDLSSDTTDEYEYKHIYKLRDRHNRSTLDIKTIMAIKANVLEIVNKDPNYIYMKENVEKSVRIYNFVNLIIAIGTLNPIGIINGLYKFGSEL